nr:MAG TPA: hypothetical protein [Caudoviricetes sp.]
MSVNFFAIISSSCFWGTLKIYPKNLIKDGGCFRLCS